jgi:hypothetical protein
MDIKDKIAEAAQAVETTWKGWFDFGKVKYSKSTAIKELINNVLVKKKWVKENGRKVRIQFVFNTQTKVLTITDNFNGFPSPWQNLRPAMNLGESFKTDAILSEYGKGLKTAVNWWGKLVRIVTTNDGDDFYALYPNYKSQIASFATLKGEPFKWFEHSDWVFKTEEEFRSGSQIVIDLKSSQIAKRKDWFTNIIKDLEAAYFDYLGETLEVELVWINESGNVKKYVANPKSIVLSSIVSIEGHYDEKTKTKVDPEQDLETGEIYKYLDKSKKIGPDIWDFEGTYTHPNGIIAQYKIGRVPHPKNLSEYYIESGDSKYNPITYETSPFRYGSPYVGISYCKKWVPISWAGFKQTRDGQEVFGFLNILEGAETVATKDGLVDSADLEEFEKDFSEFLRQRGVYVRGQAVNPKIPENVMEKNLLKKLRNSKNVRKYLGYDAKIQEFDNQYALHSGYPDIIAINPYNSKPDEDKSVIELKISHEKMWKAVVQGMAYAMELGHKKVLLVSLFEQSDFPTDIKTKLDIFKQSGWDFRYEQYQYLMAL